MSPSMIAAVRVVPAAAARIGGPRGGRGKDVLVAKGLFASPDMVAVDTAAIRFFGQLRSMPLENISYLQKGAELAVGTTDPDTLAIRRRKL